MMKLACTWRVYNKLPVICMYLTKILSRNFYKGAKYKKENINRWPIISLANVTSGRHTYAMSVQSQLLTSRHGHQHASDLPQVQSLVHSIKSFTCPVSMHPRPEILKSMNKSDVKNTQTRNIFVNIVVTLPFRRCQRPISWRTKVVLTSDLISCLPKNLIRIL